MTVALTSGGFPPLCCGRSTASGPSVQSKSSNAVVHIARTSSCSVRPPSVTCQACTPSGAPGTNTHPGLGSSRTEPTGNAEAVDSLSDSLQPNTSAGDGSQQQQQSHLHDVNARTPVVTSDFVGTVVICGWLGSNKRYLKKYQDWWTNNRCLAVILLFCHFVR